jgi:hypothetical protein
METKRQEELMSNLSSSDRNALKNFPEYARVRALEKIDSGYKISQNSYDEIEVVRGFSYYGIDRSGNVYRK